MLPYEILYREPSTENVKLVTEFSKKTGDYRNLSAVDIRVLALTLQLEKEFGDASRIKVEPDKKTEVVTHKKLAADSKMAGFYRSKKKVIQTDDTASELSEPTEEVNALVEDMKIEDHSLQELEEKPDIANEEVEDSMISEEEAAELNNNIDDAVDDDEEGWITPKNVSKIKKEMGYDENEEDIDEDVKCACLTTDFAMQNVLIQMGLHIVSVDGRLIRQARSYILKCFGCQKETHDMTKQFCPACGNKTLSRVAVTVGRDGTMRYHYNRRKKNPNIRGTKFSLPKPQPGRHGNDIITCEDQKTKLRTMPKSKESINPLDVDYLGRGSPFAANDTNSRAFALGLHVRQARSNNPNANRKSKSKRK